MTTTLRGVIRGRTIELADTPDLTDGQGVEVTIRTLVDPTAQLAAIHRTEGALADDPEFAPIMDEIERQRRTAQFRDPMP